MSLPTLEQNLDVLHATHERQMQREPMMTYAYDTYQDMNILYAGSNMQITGDRLEGQLVSGTVGNAGFKSVHAKTSLIAKNITKTYSLAPYRHCVGGMVYNKVELSVNMGPERLYDIYKLQWRKARVEFTDAIRAATWGCLSNADDVTNPASIPYWLPVGTAGSTPGWTGYQSRYNDGSTPGTAFNTAGLECSSTVNPKFATMYADHLGNIDESLFKLVNEVLMVQNFQGPRAFGANEPPKAPKFACFSSKNVILTLNALKAKQNAQVGPDLFSNGYYPSQGTTVGLGIPVVWVDILDSANLSLYGTDPIFFLNMNALYPTVLKGWDATVTWKDDPENDLNHLGLIHWCGQWWCDDRRHAGALISQHPST